MGPPLQSMWRSWLIIGTLVAIAAVIAWRSGGPERVGQALTSGSELFLGVLPNLILGFALAGFLHVLLPQELISRWMGHGSGATGLLIGTGAGMLTPGGPFTHFPILASFLSKGAGVGPVCAYIAAWALIGLNRLIVWELPILGPKIALVRFLASVAVPPFVGWLAAWLFRAFRFSPLS
ncbi:MAG: permease [Candidatus Omnitrophica bacterium]|nr:permease [Candidatus Omnitrophota bacterium]